jgi:anti-anti-sigma factor
MILQIFHAPGPGIYRLVGELDYASRLDMKTFFAEATGSGEDLVLDVSGLRFVDASGLRCLVELAESLTDPSRLILQSPTAEVRRLIDAASMHRLPALEIRDSD